MEGSRCAYSGQGNFTLRGELSETDQDMVVVVADTREAVKEMMDSFDPKKNGNEAAPNEVTLDMFVALAVKK